MVKLEAETGASVVVPPVVVGKVQEGNHSQHFIFDPSSGRLILSSMAANSFAPQSVLSSTPTFAAPSWCLSVVGNADALPMRLKLAPLDLKDDYSQRFQVSIVEEKSGKDIRQLREGFQNFLPADACNYDDWNELFCDPARLAKNAVLVDGSKLFDLPPGRRFAALHRVDWQASLADAKTHREIHSWWGVFASSHRVWLLHELIFGAVVVWTSSQSLSEHTVDGNVPVLGYSMPVAAAAAGLIVPVHAFCWKFVCWAIAGRALRLKVYASPCACACRIFFTTVMWLLPVVTYVLVRIFESNTNDTLAGMGMDELEGYVTPTTLLILHFFVSACEAWYLLCMPTRAQDSLWPYSSAPKRHRLARWIFWIAVLAAKVSFAIHIVGVLNQATESLMLTHFTRESLDTIMELAFTVEWQRDVLIYFAIWGTAILLFVSDTQLWFTVGCTVAGVLVGFSQRGWKICRLATEDSIAHIPQRFSKKVLWYTNYRDRENDALNCSPHFPTLWDRIVDHLRYEDKADDDSSGGLRFRPQTGPIDGAQLRTGLSAPPRGSQAAVPELFRGMPIAERCVRRDAGFLPDQAWPSNTELRWRLTALGRALTLELPRPLRAPHIPGITVLVPHYGESIITTKGELFGGVGTDQEFTALVTWLERRYPAEYRAFNERMSQLAPESWPRGGSWEQYTDEQWEKIGIWASMRGQTLWRTVAGMMLYRTALDCHFRVQGLSNCALTKVWTPDDSFNCLVSMQQYVHFSKNELAQTDLMLSKFAPSFKIVYIDHLEKGPDGDADGVHSAQMRRYYSCLIDRSCPKDDNGKRKPKFRVELPGYPILGDGKGDNQNHAIPFTRGSFVQCIDANQGAYFEQMLLLPCVLGEFRDSSGAESRHAGRAGAQVSPRVEVRAQAGRGRAQASRGSAPSKKNGAKKIVGFPELITSDIGSIGDFAASSEFAFGTVLQRAHAALGGRMHYGHPDIMAKTYMMQQGGVSKATKTVNLSEDIFAGMDFTLRGMGRQIVHREYFHLAKGRDMGFTSVLQFFSKLSAGAGEVLLTRQSFRIGQVLPLPEFLTFYYAHCGFYLTQHLVSCCPRALVFLWLLIVCNDSEQSFKAVSPRIGMKDPPPQNSVVAAHVLSECFSWVLVLILIAQALPFIVEVWMQQGVLVMLKRYLKQVVTLAPLHFIFQSKVIGIYVVNELQNGGAQYIATGRGLPTARRPFLCCTPGKTGLYQDFADIAFYDGVRLLCGATLAVLVGSLDASNSQDTPDLAWWGVALSLTIISWLYTPFIFNPYQFAHQHFVKDLVSIRDFFLKDGGSSWTTWYEKTQLKPGTGFRVTVLDIIYWFFLIYVWHVTATVKMTHYAVIFGSDLMSRIAGLLPFVPPVCASLLTMGVVAAVLQCRATQAGSSRVFPVGYSAATCVVLDLLELAVSLVPLMRIGWWRTCVSILILKYAMLSVALALAQCLFRITHGTRCHWLSSFLRLWLYGHRWAMDVATSSFLFWTLAPFVLFDKGRDACFRGCSFHNLLVFRAIGGVERRDQALRLGGSFATGDSRDRLLSFDRAMSYTSHDATTSPAGTFTEVEATRVPAGSSGDHSRWPTSSNNRAESSATSRKSVASSLERGEGSGPRPQGALGSARGRSRSPRIPATMRQQPQPQESAQPVQQPQQDSEDSFEGLVTDDIVTAMAKGARGQGS